MNFFQRPPSSQWEPTAVPGAAGSFIWCWFRPPHNPGGLTLNLPPECFAAAPPQCLTLRNLLSGCGVPAELLGPCFLYGQPFPGQPHHPGWLDAPIPPASGPDQTIQVQVLAPAGMPPGFTPPLAAPMAAPQAMSGGAPSALPAAVPADEHTDALLSRISSDWNSTLLLEKNAQSLRQQLSNIIAKLGSLNRDLGPDERLHADRNDQNDWQDARRWLRDAASKASRFLKEFDIGFTSNAGRRDWFEQVYRDKVSHRIPFERLAETAHEFESYRKAVQTLVSNMNVALSSARQDGEQRAQRVLSRIAAKVRKARTKR